MNNIFTETVNKYISNYDEELFGDEEIFHEMNGMVLNGTSNDLFDLNGKMIDEVKEYCSGYGYDIDKIIFVTHYDIEFTTEDRKVKKINENTLRLSRSSKMQSDSRISIVSKNGKVIAKVFMGSSLKVDKNL